ncbi:Scr1 family TA system antitoxin-like transcriptional regulator [Lentzea fradiae]|nr:Scr1 family TA system antitoxin-like transcriptional regulator [Lentzea fradiae]
MPKDFRATTLERAIEWQLAGWRNELQLSLTEAGQRVGFSDAELSMMERYVYKVPASEWQSVVQLSQHAEQARTSSLDGSAVLSTRRPTSPICCSKRRCCGRSPLILFRRSASSRTTRTSRYGLTIRTVQRCRQRSGTRGRANSATRTRSMSKPSSRVRAPAGCRRTAGDEGTVAAPDGDERVGVCLSLKIVPRGTGAYPAMGVPFTLLSFPHRQHNDVAYFETSIKGESLELIAEAIAEL